MILQLQNLTWIPSGPRRAGDCIFRVRIEEVRMADDISRVLFNLNLGHPLPVEFVRSFNAGTLRTLFIADEVAKSLGVPLDIRLLRVSYSDERKDVMLSRIDDALNCLMWAGIDVRNTYELKEKKPSEDDIRVSVSEDHVDGTLRFLSDHPINIARNTFLPQVWDDIFGVRGTLLVTSNTLIDFSSYLETRCSPVAIEDSRGGFHWKTKYISMIGECTGVEWNAMMVPCIKVDENIRMGSLNEDIVLWSALSPIGADRVRSFLLATAMSPHDPLSVVGTKFSPDLISESPYIWSWRTWYDFIEGGR